MRLVFAVVIDCGEPALFRNGQVEVNETTFGASIIYTCDPGYQMMGDATRECTQPNYDGPGMWVGDPPYCQSESIASTSSEKVLATNSFSFDIQLWIVVQ